MDIPETFTEDLEREFQGRLRAKWNPKKSTITIEQRVGRNLIGSIPREKLDTFYRLSLAEGFKLIMDIAISEIMKCGECSTKLNVPNRVTEQITCYGCKVKGRNTKYICGYYPLNSSLINHLKSIDPLRNLDVDETQRVNEHNERLMAQQQKQLSDDAESYANDNITRLMGIPQFGYSGTKVKEGTELRGFSSEG